MTIALGLDNESLDLARERDQRLQAPTPERGVQVHPVCTDVLPRKSPPPDDVVAALTRILRRGVPITSAVVDPVLLGLRGVIARAVDPSDAVSRTAALDGVLRGQLARFPDARYAESARALFGLPPTKPGQNLTTRREQAARRPGTSCTTSASVSSRAWWSSLPQRCWQMRTGSPAPE